MAELNKEKRTDALGSERAFFLFRLSAICVIALGLFAILAISTYESLAANSLGAIAIRVSGGVLGLLGSISILLLEGGMLWHLVAVHRTRKWWWLPIFFLIGPFGAVIYFYAVYRPQMLKLPPEGSADAETRMAAEGRPQTIRPRGIGISALVWGVLMFVYGVAFLRDGALRGSQLADVLNLALFILLALAEIYLLWVYYVGKRWARMLLLFQAVTTILLCPLFLSDAVARGFLRLSAIAAALGGVLMLYWLNRASIRQFFR